MVVRLGPSHGDVGHCPGHTMLETDREDDTQSQSIKQKKEHAFQVYIHKKQGIICQSVSLECNHTCISLIPCIKVMAMDPKHGHPYTKYSHTYT